MLKRICAGYYFYENKGNKIINGRGDWEKVYLFKISYKRWGYCLDHSMTKGVFPSLTQLRRYLGV